jgi:hypothetical protein
VATEDVTGVMWAIVRELELVDDESAVCCAWAES